MVILNQQGDAPSGVIIAMENGWLRLITYDYIDVLLINHHDFPAMFNRGIRGMP